jgi:transposase
MHSTTIAVDIAKSVFAVAVSTTAGRIDRRLRLTRTGFVEFLVRQKPAVVVLEACGSSHHWSRQLTAFGHTPILLPAQYVRPYVPRNKTDETDAAALLEAYRNRQIRPVAVKSIEQQALVALHRLRSAWMATRTARLNALRGFLRELGVAIPVGARHVLPRLSELLAEGNSVVPAALHPPLLETAAEIRELERRVHDVELQLRRLARQLPGIQRLLTVPGIGLLTATALFGWVGDLRRFRSGRHFASFLGLTPRERSSGTRRNLGAISKRGDAYLRTLLVHGARSVLSAAKRRKQPDRLRAWALALEANRGHNKAIVALANKLARIAWAVSTSDRDYQDYPLPAAA